MEKKLEVNNLQVSFRTKGGIVKAVRSISFDLYKGETFAIVGESGSGKSVTSKSIMGILAGNAIVEGGEILYDGQDLLKISEEDYHKIRGDKIAMIFQDPMSSLNPIMRVGHQLTEAMILKAKTGKKNSRHAFNSLLKRVIKNVIEANSEDQTIKESITAKAKIFDNFCIEGMKIETKYNDAYGEATSLSVSLENLLLLLRKQVKVELKKELKSIIKSLKLTINEYVVTEDEKYTALLEKYIEYLANYKSVDANVLAETVVETKTLIDEALVKDVPNFFTLGYYKLINPEESLSHLSVKEMNQMTLDYLNNNFMFDFIKTLESGVIYSHNKSISAKSALLSDIDEAINYFSKDELDKEHTKEYIKGLIPKVKEAIDYLEVHKNSTEYVFESSFENTIKEYFDGIKNNPIEEVKYLKQKAKYDALIEKGQTPDWVLKPQVIVDIDLKLGNIRKVLAGLKSTYEAEISNHINFDANKKVIGLIDYFKEQASRVVVKMNKQIAKAKAIKLLEEVGIPEPTIRYNQYPFEFSGGMRQRIVIAIALSANPDILICDEPTTALDVTIQAQILELINNIKKQRNLSVIFITHNLGVVANMADRIAVMYAGKIVEYGKSEEIFYEPSHPYTWALLSSMPDLHTKDKLESIPGTPPNMIYPPKGDAFAPRNKYALEIDFELEPPLFEVTPTHYAATWLLHPNAPKVEMPKIIKDRVERLKKEMENDGE